VQGVCLPWYDAAHQGLLTQFILWVCGWRQGRGVYQSICCVNKKEAGTCAYHISFVRRTVTLFFRASVMAGYSLVQSTRGDSYTLDSYTLEKSYNSCWILTRLT
jgi:hypothetical protein